jgi:integrase
VFCNTSGGYLEAGNFRLRSWLPLLERAGLLLDPPLVFHEATRHGHASLMVKLGADVKTVQARLGHSRASVTLDLYTHEVTGDSDDAAKRLDALLRSVV